MGRLSITSNLNGLPLTVSQCFEIYLNRGIELQELGQQQDAFDMYLQAIKLDPDNSNGYSLITQFLSDVNTYELNSYGLKECFILLLERNDITHRYLFQTFKTLYDKSCDYSEDWVFLKSLKKIVFRDIEWEILLTEQRKKFCNTIDCDFTEWELHFLIALGEQCFMNEYCFIVSDEENIILNEIISKDNLNEKYLSLISCYFPLYKILDYVPYSTNNSFNELINLQLLEPLKEIELSNDIKKIGSIDNSVSKEVKIFYEENPYPRWRHSSTYKENKTSANNIIGMEIYPNVVDLDIGSRILIAGCGTGEQILHAQRYQDSKITAIDLSLSSLSYAKRKVDEYHIDNVEIIQLDILDLGLLNKKFDIIECGGVLHHMDNPFDGLKSLVDNLEDSGVIALSLYSEFGRRDIINLRNIIKDKDVSNFRKDFIDGKYEEFSWLENFPDFYSTSECRDLCFHVKEHYFSIQKLSRMLEINHLNFLGFLLPQKIRSLYNRYFPEDKNQTNLQNWAKFEENHPDTFRRMYQFWVSKIINN